MVKAMLAFKQMQMILNHNLVLCSASMEGQWAGKVPSKIL
jgi:hypothetical protein